MIREAHAMSYEFAVLYVLNGAVLAYAFLVLLLHRSTGRRRRSGLRETSTPPPGWRGPRPKRSPKPVRPKRIHIPPPDERGPYREPAPHCTACGQAIPREELER